MSSFRVHRLERRLGMDLNGDGYIGGQGILSRLERATHMDLNGDHRIGRPHDVHYGYPSVYRTGGYPVFRPQTYVYGGRYY